MKIFMFEGMLVGIIGTLLGCIIGYTIAFLQIEFSFIPLPPDVYLIDTFPVELQWIDFIYISSMSIFLTR